jgi:hypothetical protein
MKKILIRLCSIAAIGLALTACNNDAANKTAIDADNSAIDQLVQDKTKALDDSLSKACDDQVSAAVDAKMDSLIKAGHKGATGYVHHHHSSASSTTTTTTTTPAAPQPSAQGGFGGAVQDAKNGATPKQGGFGGAVQDAKNGTAPKQGGFGGAVQDAQKKNGNQ